MNQVLLLLLVVVAVIMIYLGVNLGAKPPVFTGVGFIIIAALFLYRTKKD